jgi:hypothetical protein
MNANHFSSIVGSALVYATSSVASRYAGLLLMGIYSLHFEEGNLLPYHVASDHNETPGIRHL